MFVGQLFIQLLATVTGNQSKSCSS